MFYFLDSSRWKKADAKQLGPSARHGHAAIAAGSSMFIHGGQRDQLYCGDLWQLNFTSKIWTEVTLGDPVALSHHSLFWLPSKKQTDTSFDLQPFEEESRIESREARSSSRTISEEHLILKEHNEGRSIYRRLSSRKNKKTAFANDAIELSEMTDILETPPRSEKPRLLSAGRGGSPDDPTIHLNLVFESEKECGDDPDDGVRGRILILGGESSFIQKDLRVLEITIPLNLQI